MIYDDDMFVLEMDFLDMRICDVDACREDQKNHEGKLSPCLLSVSSTMESPGFHIKITEIYRSSSPKSSVNIGIDP